MQPVDYADGGDLYVYDKGVVKDYRSLTFHSLPEDDLINYLTFLDAVEGSKYTFTFTDTDGLTYTARIVNSDNIQSAPIVTGRESVTIDLLLD